MLLAMALPSILVAPMADADAENGLLVRASEDLLYVCCRQDSLRFAVLLEPPVRLEDNGVLVENLE